MVGGYEGLAEAVAVGTGPPPTSPAAPLEYVVGGYVGQADAVAVGTGPPPAPPTTPLHCVVGGWMHAVGPACCGEALVDGDAIA